MTNPTPEDYLQENLELLASIASSQYYDLEDIRYPGHGPPYKLDFNHHQQQQHEQQLQQQVIQSTTTGSSSFLDPLDFTPSQTQRFLQCRRKYPRKKDQVHAPC